MKQIPEVVINLVNHAIVHQMSLASCHMNLIQVNLLNWVSPIDSDFISPKRVKESPVQLKCKVNEVVELGANGGAGNLVICEVLCMLLTMLL